jgi:hypothetical protein
MALKLFRHDRRSAAKGPLAAACLPTSTRRFS